MAPDVRAIADVSAVVGRFYDKRALERLISRAVVYNLTEKRPMPKGIGNVAYFNRFTNFPVPTTAITEGVVPTQTYLSGNSVSSTLFQIGGWTPTSDMLDLTAFQDVVKECVSNFGDTAAKAVDQWIMSKISSDHATDSMMATIAADDVSITTWFGGKQGGLSAVVISADGLFISVGATIVSLVSAGANVVGGALPGQGWCMDLFKIGRAAAKLRSKDCLPFSDGYYRMVMHPNQADSVKQTAEWATWNIYTRPEVLDKGEFGKAHGVRMYESTVVCKTNTGPISSQAVCAYYSLIWGQGAFAVTELNSQRGVKTYVKRPNQYDTSNPIDQWSTIGWKVTMAAKALNKDCGYFVTTFENK